MTCEFCDELVDVYVDFDGSCGFSYDALCRRHAYERAHEIGEQKPVMLVTSRDEDYDSGRMLPLDQALTRLGMLGGAST